MLLNSEIFVQWGGGGDGEPKNIWTMITLRKILKKLQEIEF